MHKHIGYFVLFLTLFVSVASAQDECPLEPRLQSFGGGHVITDVPLRLRDQPSTAGQQIAELSTGDQFRVISSGMCIEGLYWYPIQLLNGDTPLDGYIAEGADGEYFVEPYTIPPTPTTVFTVPAISTPAPPITDTPLPPVTYITVAEPDDLGFVTWEWGDDIAIYGQLGPGESPIPDPFTIAPPEAYSGDMPTLPIDLTTAAFVTDAGLSDQGLALLAQNGFVVTPQGLEQFDEAYGGRNGWNPYEGYSAFITTDTMLHSLYLAFENLLTYLEQESLYFEISNMIARGYQAAEEQAADAVGTPLEDEARAAAVYYAVAMELLLPPPDETIILNPFDQTPLLVSEQSGASELVSAYQNADPSILEEAQPLVDAIIAAEGQAPIPFLVETDEDFGTYRPRGHYTISPLYERYFRALTWLGRITFRAAEAGETQTALLVLRALQSDPATAESRQKVGDTLEFLIGPVDNLGPEEYAPLADQVFGDDLNLDAIADDALLAEYQARLEELPPPSINTAVLPEGTQVEQLDEIGRGFRLFGQRFTIDANILQQVIDPYIFGRTIPTALDVPAALGSDTSFALSEESGASAFSDYVPQMTMLREEVSDLTAQDWLANIYSGWLWTLQPFWVRDANSYPPMMNTDAWLRHDLQTGLSSYTELKHATILYTAQPMGGRGGGGELPLTYAYVEPNPLVFARVAIMSEALYLGLLEKGLVEENGTTYLSQTHRILRMISRLSAYLADIAQRELIGEGPTESEHLFLQYSFSSFLAGIREDIQILQEGPPKPVALVTDITSNGVTGEVLQEAVGGVDYIYVVIPTPNGLQVARGAVYSYYEFVNQDGQRMTDEEWREIVASGDVPPRPAWISAFLSE